MVRVIKQKKTTRTKAFGVPVGERKSQQPVRKPGQAATSEQSVDVKSGSPIFRKAVETQEIERFCRAMKKGQEVTDVELCKAIGATELRSSWWATATRTLVSEGVVMVRRNHKIRRLTDAEVAPRFSNELTALRRRQRRRIAELATVDVRKLDNDDRIRRDTAFTIAAMLYHIVDVKSVRQIASKVEAAQQALPINSTITALLQAERRNGDHA